MTEENKMDKEFQMPKEVKIDMSKLLEVYNIENVISSLEKELFLVNPNDKLNSVSVSLKALKSDSIEDYTSILDV